MNITGSLQQSKGYWCAMLRVPKEDGGKKQKVISLHMKVGEVSKADAQRAFDDVLYQARHDMISFDKDSFVSYLGKWLNHHEMNVQETTILKYRNAAERYIIPFYKERRTILQKMNVQDVQDFIDHLYREKELSGNTVRSYYLIVNGALDWAVKNEMIPKNPAKQADLPPKTRSTVARSLAPEEYQKLLAECRTKTLYTAVFLAANLGLRFSEAAGLCWDCVDFDEKVIHIRRRRTTIEGKVFFNGNLKTESSRRDLPMSDAVCNFLEELRTQQKEDQLKWGEKYVSGNFVLRQENGRPCNGNAIDSAFRRARERAKIPKCRLHDLRHTAASLALKNGANMKEVQVFLGHSSISTTADIYAHVDMEQKKNLTDELTAVLAG